MNMVCGRQVLSAQQIMHCQHVFTERLAQSLNMSRQRYLKELFPRKEVPEEEENDGMDKLVPEEEKSDADLSVSPQPVIRRLRPLQ